MEFFLGEMERKVMHALIAMESKYQIDYLYIMDSLTCVMELKVIHAKMERSQRIQLFSFMDWNHLYCT
jgi:hypothetical protein